MKRCTLIIVSLMACIVSDVIQARETIFYNIGPKEGLSYSSVRDITQDNYGFIWIASLKGLNRFDGYNIVKYVNDNESGLDTDTIEAVEALDNDIILGTNIGLFRYDSSQEHFFKVESSGSVQVGNVTDICRNSNGEAYIASSTGIFRYSGSTLSLFFDETDIFKLCCGKNDNLIAIGEKTLYQLSPEGAVLKTLTSKEVCGTDDEFTCLSFDDNGTLWLGMMGSGVFQYNLSTSVHNQILINDSGAEEMNYVRALMADGEGKIWIGTENGLFVYDITSHSSVHYKKSISSRAESISDNAIYCIFKSREGIIWIGSFFGGVDYINEKSEYFEYILPDDGKRSLAGWATSHIMQDRSGRIWFASEDNGISILNPSDNSFSYLNRETTPQLNGNNVHALAEDYNGNIWVGNFVDGLQRISPDIKKRTVIPTPDNSIYKLYPAGRDSLLIGAMNGAWVLNTRTMEYSEIASDVIGCKRVDDMVFDKDGILWLCLHFDGIARYDFRTDEIRLFNSKSNDEILSDFVYCVHCCDDDGELWFGTSNGGLLEYRDGVFRKYDNNGEFLHRTICSIQEDDFGRLWLSTNEGIYSFETETGTFRKYHSHNELVSSQFNLSAGRRIDSGDIFFGSIKGVVRFSPKNIGKSEKLTVRPVIYLSGLSITNRLVCPDDDKRILRESLNETDKISLKYNQNTVALDIIPVIQADKDKQLLSMKYRLAGLDESFHTVPAEPLTVNYAHLRSGDYVLNVILEDAEGDLMASHSLKIDISRHPLVSLPMMLFYVILFLTASILIFKNFKKRNLERMELNLSEQRLNFFTFISHEFKTPLSIIMSLIDSNDSGNSEILTARNKGIILKNIKQMQYLIRQLMDFRFLESSINDAKRDQLNIVETIRSLFSTFTPVYEKKNVESYFTSNEDSFICFQDKDKIVKIFGNLFSNAAKNVENSGIVRFTLDIDKDKLKAVIFNSGSYIPENQRESIFQPFFMNSGNGSEHSGIGLTLVKELVHILNGTLSVESKKDVGTSFIVVLPINDSEDSKESVQNSDISAKEYEYLVDNIMYDISPYTSEDMEQEVVQPKKYTILLVENNVDFNNILSEKLASEYSIIQVFDGKQSQKYISSDIDMLIADINLEGVSGFQLCRAIKGNANTAHIPVILLAKNSSEEDKVIGLECGADAYLEKPFNAQELMIRVNNIFKNKENIKTHFKNIIRLDNISSLNNKEEIFIKNLTDYIIDNIQDANLDVDSLAGFMGISRTHLYYKLRSYVNLSATEFITKIRLSKAEEMLSNTTLRISEISWKVGFSSPGYFSKVFKQHYGKTPNEFRLNK